MDVAAVVAAVPGDYDGNFMTEVDEPSVGSKLESHRIPFDWVRQNLPEVRT